MTTGSQRPQRVLVEPGDQTDHDQLSIDAIPRPGLGIGDRAIRIHFRPIDVENRFGLNHGILHIAHPRNRLHGAGIDQTILYKAIIDIDSNHLADHDEVPLVAAGFYIGQLDCFPVPTFKGGGAFLDSGWLDEL